MKIWDKIKMPSTGLALPIILYNLSLSYKLHYLPGVLDHRDGIHIADC